ncbi:L,D-transpeptidase [uncultured Jatrophihabitans sp.]|uniref:L,D-transpeptidase n=1 Tax=uncultured Jatrophihabitans sp. TaxID=1610747 RepID=UPI0035C9E90E
MPFRLAVVAAGLGAAALLTSCAAQTQQTQAARPAAQHATAPVTSAPATSAPTTRAPASPTKALVPAACASNRRAKLVLVDVSQQHLWLCQGARSTFDSPVTSGAVDLPYDSTPTGTFEVQQKDRNRTLTLLGGQQYRVKYWIPFQGPLFGFHDAGWQKMPFGSQKYRTKGSHGCVHLPLATIAHLYHWADVGTPVRIRH